MPPKRKLRAENVKDASTDSISERTASPLPEDHRPHCSNAAIHAGGYAALPIDAVLSQIVGVATRLSKPPSNTERNHHIGP
jgi:hypothetical protein